MKTLIGGAAFALLVVLSNYIVNAVADVVLGWPIAIQSVLCIALFVAVGSVFVKVAIND